MAVVSVEAVDREEERKRSAEGTAEKGKVTHGSTVKNASVTQRLHLP